MFSRGNWVARTQVDGLAEGYHGLGYRKEYPNSAPALDFAHLTCVWAGRRVTRFKGSQRSLSLPHKGAQRSTTRKALWVPGRQVQPGASLDKQVVKPRMSRILGAEDGIRWGSEGTCDVTELSAALEACLGLSHLFPPRAGKPESWQVKLLC